MTKEQYISPECHKFTVEDMDYYVHAKMAPYGASLDYKFINTRTQKFVKLSIQQQRSALALAFVPNPNNYKYAGPRYGGDDSVSVENTEWSRSTHKNVRSVGLYIGESLSPLELFKCVTDAARFVLDTKPYCDGFTKSGSSIITILTTCGSLVSSCGTYQLLSAK